MIIKVVTVTRLLVCRDLSPSVAFFPSKVYFCQCLTSMLLDACYTVSTLRPRQNGRRLADDTFKRIFLNENVRISIKISLKFFPKGPINNIPSLVQIMAWHRSGDKLLSEPMMVSLPTHICITRPQWVHGVGGAVRFLVVGTIGQRERPPRGQLWMEQCLTLLKYWPI